MTQAELAARLGQYQSFVARLESGQRCIDVVEFLELSEILGFDAAEAVEAIKLSKTLKGTSKNNPHSDLCESDA